MLDIVSIVVGLLVVVLATVYLLGRRRTRSIKKTIPGWDRKPADPLKGDLSMVFSTGSLHEYLLQQHEDGSCPVTSFWWGSRQVVSVCTPKAFRETENLYNRPIADIVATFSDPLHGSQSIQSINEDEWKERRRLLQGTVRGKNLESFFDDFAQVAHEAETLWSPDKPLDLLKEMFRMTLKAILCTCLGNIFEDDSGIEDLADTYHRCKTEMDQCILDAHLPGSQRELAFQEDLKRLHGFMRQMVQARQAQKKDGSTAKKLPLLDAMLESDCSEEVLLSDMVTFMGGFHTSGNYATWVFLYLAQHDDVQEKLLREIAENSERLKSYALSSQTYLRQVLDESLRVSTIAPQAPHISSRDEEVEGCVIPANTPIFHAIGVALKSKETWTNPDEFCPERFDPGSKHAKRGYEFRPFGISQSRRCPANHFTYFMMSTFVSILLQHFRFVTSTAEQVKVEYGIAASPKDRVLLEVKLRDTL